MSTVGLTVAQALVPSSESWWDVPVSEVAQLGSTQQARKVYESHKAEQLAFLNTQIKIADGIVTIHAGELPTPGPDAAAVTPRPPCA